MVLSDHIARLIAEMLEEGGGTCEVRRNDLASKIGCVPSQINYVITSRFTPERGYVIESRRGGGGYIRISRVRLDKSSALMHIINSVGSELDTSTARILIENSRGAELITNEAAELMKAATSSTVLRQIPPPFRDSFRAAVVKQMLLSLI